MNSDFKHLIDKYLQSSLSVEETAQLQSLLQRREHLDSLEAMILAELQRQQPEEADDETVRNSILEKLETKMALLEEPAARIKKIPWRTLAAASILLVFTGGWFYFHYAAPLQAALTPNPI